MHPELIQLLDVELSDQRRRCARGRALAASCPRVAVSAPVARHRGADALRRRVGFWLVAAGLRLALPRL